MIYKNGLFGIFKDNKISHLQFSLFFICKCLAIPVFYWVYQVYYGGIENYDAGLFFKDSKIINSIAYDNFGEYLRVLFGFQNDAPGTYLYTHYLSHTSNWDEGISWRLFFNDNKTIIRIHSLIHFISFNSYFVHALFSCLFGYIGIAFIYKSLKHLFVSKELFLIGAFVFLPNLWLFSGALLKEPILLFNIGVIFVLTDRMFVRSNGIGKKVVSLILVLSLIYYLKPQVTFPVFILFFAYKAITSFDIKHKGIYYIVSILLIAIVINVAFLAVKKVSVLTFINKKQTEFYDVMKGGIFLKDNTKFVRLPYDKTLINIDDSKKESNVTIKNGVAYCYWEDTHQMDTLLCESNKDTLTKYSMMYALAPANSGFSIAPLKTDFEGLTGIFKAIYFGLFYPIKFNSLINAAVSLENILIMICFLISLYGLVVSNDKTTILFFMSMVIALSILFAIATPNTGAIVRYRSVIVPFLLLAAIYTLNKKHEAGRIR